MTLAEASVWRGKRIEPTGFYWLGARYYDPIGARFLSPDPVVPSEKPFKKAKLTFVRIILEDGRVIEAGKGYKIE